MAAILKTSPEEMISIVMELKYDINSLGHTMDSIQEKVDRLNTAWSGEATNAFMGRYKEADNHIRELMFMLSEYSDKIMEMSRCYSQAESAYLQDGIITPADFK